MPIVLEWDVQQAYMSVLCWSGVHILFAILYNKKIW